MIKANSEKGTVKVKGTTASILTELTMLCISLKENGLGGIESEEELKEALHDAVDMAFRPTESLIEEALLKLAEDFKEVLLKGKGEK